MTAQRENPTTWPANVAEQQLQHRRGANDLNAFRMLCPTEGITNCRGLVRTRRSDKRVGNFVKKHRRDTANFLHHFRRVASEVAAQCLKNAARMLQGQIALGETEI